MPAQGFDIIAGPLHEQKKLLDEFRGNRGHDFDWLRSKYFDLGGARLPAPIALAFSRIPTWNTSMRYNPSEKFEGKIGEFMGAVELIRNWALERI